MNRATTLFHASAARVRVIGLTAAVCVVSLGGCAHAPPQELLDARAAYQTASHGVAQQETPTDLHTAKNALDSAERSFDDDGDSEHTRDLAYVAMRKAQLAEVKGHAAQEENRLTELKSRARREDRQDLQELRGKYATQQEQLEASQDALAAAEKRARQATADLARIANVKQEDRGTVITLSGAVLFTSGKSELLPSAQAKLSEVADALTQQNKAAPIVVEGYTDSQGSDAFNLTLSRERAQAVREYLASHGVAEDRIRAEGLGSSRPIADNNTPQGRANNRRVEIVVQPAPGA